MEGIRPRRGCPEIHHLFFVDDSPLFVRVSVEKARNLRQTIEEYCSVSGQKVNYQKFSMYFNYAAGEEFKREILNVFTVQQVLNLGHYLGLLTI